ncbi:PTS sugar transporter subunit IIA [Olsenella uli]|uniref:PTS sugar transporter subunit IIA n=1 Tax=Olsenella uli TaxID=133926 RepID=UPI00138AEB1D|nr:PTS sugar transporter subunit IIA [Olsenella uli]
MRRIVLVSHGELAQGMMNSLEMIAGKQPHVTAIGAYMQGSPDVTKTLLSMASKLGDGDELVIVTDLLGGSVNNEAAQLRTLPNVFVVSGMNLGLVLSLALSGEKDTVAAIKESIKGARRQLVWMDPSDIETDEEF